MGKDIRDTRRGGYMGVGILLFGGVVLSLMTSPANAQGPTVTPYPGPILTITASWDKSQAAQQAAARADQQVRDGQRAAAEAAAQFDAAQRAEIEARALLETQQIAAASEALGRAFGLIAAGQARISDTLRIVDNLNSTIGQQADQISSLIGENQQLKADKKTILSNYDAMKARADKAESAFVVNPVIAVLAGGFLLSVVLVFVAWKWNNSPPPTSNAPPTHDTFNRSDVLEGEYHERTNEED